MARNFSKLNFVDAVKIITPNLYLNQDAAVSGSQIKFTDLIINSHLHSINNITSTLKINAVAGSYTASDINTPTGFSRYFIKQNNLTNITLEKFIDKILTPLKLDFSTYKTAESFKSFLESTVLPKIRLNSDSPQDDTSAVFGSTASETHEYLINNLGWLYFLNTSGPVASPSALVSNSIINTLYKGKPYQINDALKDYQSYLWLNNNSFSSIDERMIPDMFLRGNGSFTNGTQNLEKMHTFIDVIYSPLHIDREEVTIKNAIESFLGNSQTVLATTEVAGPLNKFYRAVSYLMRDIDSEVENLELLTSISKCPKEFLPYLANLIGWRLRGNNEASWRNQIQNATNLYKKKGTKAGLVDALNTVIVNNPIDVSSSITEMYESYIPNLLYYLLKTESDVFNSDSYDAEKAASMGIDIYDPSDKDKNIRAGVDYILKRAVQKFPHLFFIKNEPFRVSLLQNGQAYFGPTIEVDEQYYTGTYLSSDSERVAILGDPNFTFHYRGRKFPIPPWEEEKFYKNCIVTEDLLAFFRKQLKAFCVPSLLAEEFYKYTQSYTVSGSDTLDLYIGNSFVFFTSSQQYPPNQDAILSSYEARDYGSLSLWNGKSSTFDFSVCGGPFSGTFFGDSSGLHTVEDIVESLSIVDEFTPAKAIPRVRFSLSAVEQPSGLDYICPTITWPILDIPASSTGLSNYEVSGVYDRGTGYALGYDLYLSSFDDSRSTVDHANVPVFKRDQTLFSNHVYNSVVNTSLVVPAASGIPRRSLRRRNFYNTLNDNKWFGRDGRNMPIFYNNTSSLLSMTPLGYSPSSMGFVPATDLNLSTVYVDNCRVTGNTATYNGVAVSNTFPIRGQNPLIFSSCDQFVRRDQLSEEVELFFGLHEKKKKAIANEVVRHNSTLLNGSATWVNLTDSFANEMVDDGFDKYTSPGLDIRQGTSSRREGIHSIYKAYNDYFLQSAALSALPEVTLQDVEVGGPTIISHTYGPIYHNANFSLNASAVDLSSNLLTTTTDSFYNINLQKLYNAGNNETNTEDTFRIDLFDSSTQAKGPYFGGPEYTCHTILSSINFVDTSATGSTGTKMGVYFLDNNQQSDFSIGDNYLINNKCVYLKHAGVGLPRIQLQMRGIDPEQKNILLPEHDFELSLDYLTGKEASRFIGGGDVGVVIRTKNEITTTGERVFFAWTPRGEWEMVKVADVVAGNQGIQHVVKHITHQFSTNEETMLETDFTCNDESDDNSVFSYVSKKDMQNATIKFHTKNSKTKLPIEYATYYNVAQSDIYNGRNVQLHRAFANLGGKTQNYIIEVFPLPKNNSENSYVLLDKIRVTDMTLNSAAAVPYSAIIPDVNRQKEPTTSQKFILPDGSDPFSTTTFHITGLDDLTTQYYSIDLFRAISEAMTLQYEMFSCEEDPLSPLYCTVLTPNAPNNWVFPSDGNGLIAMYLHRGKGSLGQSTPTFEPTNAAWDFGLPWGKIPYTGICNNTYTFHTDGFATTDLHEQGFDDVDDRIEKKKNILENYWSDRRGFLSVNQWSSFPNTRKRHQVGKKYISISNPDYGTEPNYNQNAIGPGQGCYWWQPTGNHPAIHNQGTDAGTFAGIGWPLLGLSRPGHASYEQSIVTDDAYGNYFKEYPNPQGKYALEEYFCYDINDDFPADGFEAMGEVTNYTMKPGVSLAGQPYNPSEQDTSPNFKLSPGAPIMLDFTSWRSKYNRTLGSGDIAQELLELDTQDNWRARYYNQQILKVDSDTGDIPGEMDLKEQLLTPLVSTPSSMAVYNLVNTEVENTLAVPGDLNSFNSQRFQWQERPTFDESFLAQGHGVTFPIMSVYRDTLKADLLDDTYYTFSCWLATTHENFIPDGPGSNVLENRRNSYATSAILTIQPIGSQETYTRAIIKLPEPISQADFNAGVSRNSATSSIDTGGYLYADSSAARITEVSIPASDQSETQAEIRWFKVDVTMKYDAFELDTAGKANLGIRCSIQAYNDTFDTASAPDGDPGDLGGTVEESWAARESYLANPCRLLTWGYMFNARPDLAIGVNDDITGFTRKLVDINGIGGATWHPDFQNAPGTAPAIVYEGNGSVVNPKYEAVAYEQTSSKQIYNLSGTLSTYNKDTSSLQKLTVLKDEATNNPRFASRLFKTVNLYDNSGLDYTGDTQLTIEGSLLRKERYVGEPESNRRLSVSGDTQGSYLTKFVQGTVPMTPKELLHAFRYFNKIGKGVDVTHYADPGRFSAKNPMNSRVAHDSSAVHCSGGGSRLDYTINPDNPHYNTTTANYENFTRIDTLG